MEAQFEIPAVNSLSAELMFLIDVNPSFRISGSYCQDDVCKIPTKVFTELEKLHPLLAMYPNVPVSLEATVARAVILFSTVGTCDDRLIASEEFDEIRGGTADDDDEFKALCEEYKIAGIVRPFLQPFQHPRTVGDFLQTFVLPHPYQLPSFKYGGNIEVNRDLMARMPLFEYVKSQPPLPDMKHVLDVFLGPNVRQLYVHDRVISFDEFSSVMDHFMTESTKLEASPNVQIPVPKPITKKAKSVDGEKQAKPQPDQKKPKAKKTDVKKRKSSELIDSDSDSCSKKVRPKKPKGPKAPFQFVAVKEEPE